MNPSIRLLALDMDGTLFGEDLVISEPVKQAVRMAAAGGVLISIASGRIAEEGLRVIADLGLTTAQVAPIIAYQGALVYQPNVGPLHSLTLDPLVAIEIITYTRRLGLGVNLHTDSATYVERPHAADTFYADISQLAPILVADLVAFVRDKDIQPLKLVMVNDALAATNVLVSNINARWGEHIVAARSHPRFCEVTNPRANKGEALAYVADYLRIPIAQVMAIGDNQNDIPMLRDAGLGVAMGHAAAEVKAAADVVTGTLAEDGVATAISCYILRDALCRIAQPATASTKRGCNTAPIVAYCLLRHAQ